MKMQDLTLWDQDLFCHTASEYISLLIHKGYFNSSGADAGTFCENWLNLTADDDLAPCVTRLSATKLLTT